MMKKREKTELITGLDIGSTAVRIAVAKQTLLADNSLNLQIIGLVEVPSEGVNKGVITSIEECVSSISHALEKIEHVIGVPIEHAWVGISDDQITSQESKGVVAIAKSDGEISEEDIERTIEAARTVATPLNYEILHILPSSFCVDGQTGIKDPVGMTGVRLEVETRIIQGLSSHIKNVSRTVYRSSIDIDDLVFSILAIGGVVTTSRQRELGVVVVNIGASTTSLLVYEEGDVIHTAVLPIGSEHITSDLAIGLRTSIEIAEKVKIKYGGCNFKDISKKDVLNLNTLSSDVNEEVSKRYVNEIIVARIEEILEKVDEELEKVERSGLLPAGIVLTGGGSKLSGLVDLTKDKMRLPVSLGYPLNLRSINEKINDLSFATAIGLVNWGANSQHNIHRPSGLGHRAVDKVSKQVRGWFKSLIP